jgi:hypothetical protein
MPRTDRAIAPVARASMPTLSSVLVQREIATMRAVEEAIARQVLHGGDLVTNLLEVAGLDERALVSILGETTDLPPAPPGKLPAPTAQVLRIVPGELALRHGLFPLELEGRTLRVAVADKLSATTEEDLGFALDVELETHIAPLVRIRQAIAEHYGIPLDRRFLRLVAKLEQRPDPSPSSMPPALRGPGPVSLPRPASVPPPTFGTGHLPYARKIGAPPPLTRTPLVAPPEAPVELAIPPNPPPALSLEPLTPMPSPSSSEPPSSGPVSRLSEDVARPDTPSSDAPAPSSGPSARSAEGLVGWVRRASAEAPRSRGARRPRRGPFTAAMAEAELEAAGANDVIFDVLLDFAQQFFEYTALFTVQGDLAEGRDASGPGADRDRVAGLGVPLDLPSSLATARARAAPLVVRMANDGLDAELSRDLGRDASGRGLRVILPIAVRGRVVGLLYGDDGESDVELSAIGDVLAIAALVGPAIERVIRLKKSKKAGVRPAELAPRSRVSPSPSPRPDPRTGAAALARVVGTPAPGAVAASAPVVGSEASASPSEDELASAAEQAPAPEPFTWSEHPPVQVSPGAESVRTPVLGGFPSFSDLAAVSSSPPPPADDDGEDIHSVLARAAEAAPDVGAFPDKSRAVSEGDLTAGFARTSEPPGPKRHKTLPGMPAPSSDPPLATVEEASPRAPHSTRRGAAPELRGRARNALGQPLPPSPPPNATSSSELAATEAPPPPVSPPVAPPPIAPSPRRDPSRPPIPREDVDTPHDLDSPGTHAFVAALGDGGRASLPSIIVDVDAEYASLLRTFLDGGAGADQAFAELVRHAEAIVPALMARFPGPLRVDRHRARDQLAAASQCGPILELVVASRRVALPFVTVRSASPDPEIRFWATHVLGELRYVEAANALVPRLFDDDVSVRRIARRSAAQLVLGGASGQPLLKGLDDLTRNLDEPIERRVLAIDTMGEIRVGAMVPPLVAVLADVSDDVGDAARRALLLITRQDFARDTRRWLEWWSANGARHRIEWLMDALMHETPAVRRAAGDELKQLTKEYFGYYDDLPKRERERAQARYREWWEREGRERFR